MSIRMLAGLLIASALFIGCEREGRDARSDENGAAEKTWPTGLTPGPGTSLRKQASEQKERSAESPAPTTRAQ